MPIYALGDLSPTIAPTAFVHPDAVIIGSVIIGPESTVWPSAVLRGDGGSIIVGSQTSVQDGSIIHCTGTLDTKIGSRVTIGHNVHMEGCVVDDDALVGSGSVVLQEAFIGRNALVGAGAVVSPGTQVPPFARALGVPARVTLDVIPENAFLSNAEHYVKQGHRYRGDLRRLD